MLADLGCGMAQGYLINPPVPGSELPGAWNGGGVRSFEHGTAADMKLGIRHQLWALFGLFLLTGATVLCSTRSRNTSARQSLLALRGESLLGLREIKSVSDAYGLDVVDTTFRTRNYLITWEDGEAVLDAARVRIDRSWASLARLPRTPEEERTSAPPRRNASPPTRRWTNCTQSWPARTSTRSGASPTRACIPRSMRSPCG
jgi:hypothetical protein